jgi:hypothetical protein
MCASRPLFQQTGLQKMRELSIFLEDGLEQFGGRLAQHFADFKNESGRKKYFQTSDPPKNRGLGVYLY